MDKLIKDIKCDTCSHKEVCLYKEDFNNAINAIKLTKMVYTDCVSAIEVNCRYYSQEVITCRDTGFSITTTSSFDNGDA